MRKFSSSSRDPDYAIANRAEIQRLEKGASLPSARIAEAIKVIGALGLLFSAIAATSSVISAVSGAAVSLGAIATGQLLQWVFDIRTLMLRSSEADGKFHGVVPNA